MIQKSIPCALAIACVILAGCDDTTLFQSPPRGSKAISPPVPSDSVITLVARAAYTALDRAAEAKIPKSVPLSGDGHVACLDIPYVNPGHVGSHQECANKPYVDFRGVGTERVCVDVPDITGPSISTRNQCADYRWNATAEKDGPLQTGRAGTGIRVTQNIHVTGKAGLGGDLASILSLSGKSFDVRVAAATALNVGLNNQWCPVVKVNPVGRWVDAASVEVVGRNCLGIDLGALGHPEVCAGPVNLGLADILNGEFDKHHDDIQNATQGIISCDTIRSKVSAQWHPFSIRIDRPGKAPMFFNIDPTTAAFSGLIAEESGIKIVLRVGAKTVLSPTDMENSAGTLPQLDRVSANQGDLDISLQAEAPYDFLRTELVAALTGKTFKKDTAAGAVEVRVDDVEVYPSNGLLALGLKVDAKLPGHLLNTSGWVYLSGRPVPAPEGKALAVEDLRFATVLDNEFWTAAQSLFETEILSALKEHATFDLNGEIDKAATEVTSAIAKASVPGLKFTAGKPAIALSAIHVGPDKIVAVVKLSMTFDTEITAALIQ